MTQSETEIKKEICSQIKQLGFSVYRMNAGKVRVRGGWMSLCPKNTPDVLVNCHGFFVWIEAKKEGEKANKEQFARHLELEENGDFVICKDSVRATVDEFLVIEKQCKLMKNILHN